METRAKRRDRALNAIAEEQLRAVNVVTGDLSLTQGLKEIDGPSAAKKELSQCLHYKSWHGVNEREFSRAKIKRIIRSTMFLRRKKSGVMKARLVGGRPPARS